MYTAEDAGSGSAEPTFWFGRFRGHTVSSVPITYVIWLLVGPTTTSECSLVGNYSWLKRVHPHMFEALKKRLVLYIEEL